MFTLKDQQMLEKLIDLRKEVNLNNEEERYNYLCNFYRIIHNMNTLPTNLVELLLHPKEIECLLWDSMNYKDKELGYEPGDQFIAYASVCYKYKPEVDENGIISPRRTTLIHHAVKNTKQIGRDWRQLFIALFDICGRFDVNYTDESGYTHFHAACRFNCSRVVQGFLEHGQDPNCIWPETGDSALHIALKYAGLGSDIMEILLRGGANPNVANDEGSTPLHIICQRDIYRCDEFVKFFFKINGELNQLVQINARDKLGDTPLHVALEKGQPEVFEVLLRNGASPNLANDEGLTPLHIISKKDNDDGLMERFFEVIGDVQKTVKVDARDNLGRTPLQLAAMHCLPYAVESLLNHGADQSNFVFPTISQLDECFESYEDIRGKFLFASGFLAVVECLEKRGYELESRDALMIMILFQHHYLFQESWTLDELLWYDDDEELANEARQKMLKSDLSLYDLIHLRPQEAAKRLTYLDYYEFGRQKNVWWIRSKMPAAKHARFGHLCETMSRKFFRSWALDPFWKLIHYRLPLECCELVLDELMNQDLFNIFVAGGFERNCNIEYVIRLVGAGRALKRVKIEW